MSPIIQDVPLAGNGTITAVDNANSVLANGNATQATAALNVRANDLPNAGTVSIDPATANITVTNGGATAVPTVVNGTSIVWTLTAPATATTATARAIAKRGTYKVTYTLTNGTATATATYTLTLN